jgi:riboflavin kinase/FMN adenylyltransferase
MQVIRVARLEDLAWDIRTPVAGMGTLDGVHLGHQALLKQVTGRAAATGGTPAVVTFARHPLEVVRPAEAPPLITPLRLKLKLLEAAGVAAAVALEFTPAMAQLPATVFVEEVLSRRLGVAGLCVGYDFGFGRGREGTPALLQALGPRLGFWVEVLPPVSADGQVVSSRGIRALLGAGDVEAAQRLLGRPYCLEGAVQRGAGRGTALGFATANLPVPEPAVLKDGVYAGRVLVRGAFRDAMMNLGVAPTFADGQRRLEIHLPGWTEPLYGEHVVAYFLRRLRDELRFPDAAALTRQLAADRQAAEAAWDAARAMCWTDWALQP